MKPTRIHIASPRGQTLVEFALIAPIMFIFLFGIIDFGMALNRRIAIEHAVREGARYAAVHLDADGCTAIQDRTAERAGGSAIDSGEVDVHYYDPGGNPVTHASTGDTVRVTAPFQYSFPLMSVFGRGPIDVTITGEAQMEGPLSNAEGCPP